MPHRRKGHKQDSGATMTMGCKFRKRRDGAMTVGQALRTARRQAGLLLWQAADELGMDKSTLSRYETDDVYVPEKTINDAVRLYRNPLPQLVRAQQSLAAATEVWAA